MSQVEVLVAGPEHCRYAEAICEEMARSAAARGTGIAKRNPAYIQRKMRDKHAIIALDKESKAFAGFCYIEVWDEGKYVANSGLIVSPDYRKQGLAKRIKRRIFQLSRRTFPAARIVGLTTSLAVMKINSELGYYPVPFSEMPQDRKFWNGCQSCVNYEILKGKDFKNCLCTGMTYEPKKLRKRKWNFAKTKGLLERWLATKNQILMQVKAPVRKSVQQANKLWTKNKAKSKSEE